VRALRPNSAVESRRADVDASGEQEQEQVQEQDREQEQMQAAERDAETKIPEARSPARLYLPLFFLLFLAVIFAALAVFFAVLLLFFCCFRRRRDAALRHAIKDIAAESRKKIRAEQQNRRRPRVGISAALACCYARCSLLFARLRSRDLRCCFSGSVTRAAGETKHPVRTAGTASDRDENREEKIARNNAGEPGVWKNLPDDLHRTASLCTSFWRKPEKIFLEHDPEKACPGLDPGWKPVFGKDHAPAKC
jgi:hypothetical protein